MVCGLNLFGARRAELDGAIVSSRSPPNGILCKTLFPGEATSADTSFHDWQYENPKEPAHIRLRSQEIAKFFSKEVVDFFRLKLGAISSLGKTILSHGVASYPSRGLRGVITKRCSGNSLRTVCYTTDYSQSFTEPRPNEINVGEDGIIRRWPKDAILKYHIYLESCPEEHRENVEQSFHAAVNVMNQKGKGHWPTFEHVADAAAAVFQVSYKDKADNPSAKPFASAFFPGAVDRTVFVYARALKAKYIGSHVPMFLHELGHILGLRHEFAPEQETTNSCVTIGERNPLSFMNYFKHLGQLELQDSDVEQLKEFYGKEGSFQDYKIKVKEPKLRASGREVHIRRDSDMIEITVRLPLPKRLLCFI